VAGQSVEIFAEQGLSPGTKGAHQEQKQQES
jgi:hypothetical protein